MAFTKNPFHNKIPLYNTSFSIPKSERADAIEEAFGKSIEEHVVSFIKLLCEKEYVYEDGKHLYLTEKGRAYAESVYERHCIIREYLIACGVSPAVAEEDACNMEHVISDETFSMMKKALNK